MIGIWRFLFFKIAGYDHWDGHIVILGFDVTLVIYFLVYISFYCKYALMMVSMRIRYITWVGLIGAYYFMSALVGFPNLAIPESLSQLSIEKSCQVLLQWLISVHTSSFEIVIDVGCLFVLLHCLTISLCCFFGFLHMPCDSHVLLCFYCLARLFSCMCYWYFPSLCDLIL